MVVQETNLSKPSVKARDKQICSDVGNIGNIKHERKHRLKQRFEVRRKLGQGTYGKVQLAVNKETGQEVAVKTIKKSKIESEQDLTRIRREIQIMSSIQHPHIIHIYEVFENKDKIVLVMQYASGGELYEYVSERKVLNDNEARRLFRQVATAVYYCHKNKVCHRDLKLENILLDEKGNAKIGDFGLSNVFDERHFLSTFCGSPLYASPEIVKGTPYYGPEVDCWSLGVLLYTLVYGAMPFDGSNFKRLVKQISEANYFEPKQKSDASALIRKLLAVNPAKRATIIDICTDWWVNKGYEHTLLQVAEDLANLTPVRLDVLLALAPISPSPSASDDAGITGHPLGADQVAKTKKKKIKPKKPDSFPELPSESSTDITTCPEEDDTSTIENSTTEFLPAAVAAALEEEYQTGLAQQQSTKRQASASFDQSMSRIPSQVLKKKKPKKSEEEDGPTSLENQSSGYASESTTLSSKDAKEKKKMSSTETLSELSPIEEAKPALETVAAKETSEADLPTSPNPDENALIDLTPSSTSKTLKKSPTPSKEPQNLSPPTSYEKLDTIATDTSKPADASTSSIGAASADVGAEAASKNKSQLERRHSSAGRKVGRVSIPKFVESSKQENIDKKPVPSYGTVSDVKKAFQKRSESIDKGKQRVVPTVSVGDVKKAFERRASLPSGAPLWKNAGERRTSEVPKPDVLKEKDKALQATQTRSMSVGEPLTAPKKLLTMLDKKLDANAEGEEEKKRKAKEVVTRQISVSQLKQQQSIDSVESKESSATVKEVSDVTATVGQPPKATQKPEPAKSVAEIKLTFKPRGSSQEETVSVKSPNLVNEMPKFLPNASVPSTPDAPASKAAPITRSYKKVTFTKDGACITETGKIISEEGADGLVTRVEKKSKVTHYPGGQGEGVTRREETTSTIKSMGGSFEDDVRSGSITPPTVGGKPTVRRSESASSSGSTDIFDDIFDTWSGDPAFGNLSNRMRSLLHGRSPFTSLLKGPNKKSKRKPRTESCERPIGAEVPVNLKKSGHSHSADQESDTDNEHDGTFGNGGLWRFLGARSPSKLFERHRSLLSKHFGDDQDIFADTPFSAYARSASRDRAGSASSRFAQPSVRMVFSPSGSGKKMFTTTTTVKQDSFESSEGSADVSAHATPRASISSVTHVPGRTYVRTWSRETSEPKTVIQETEGDDGLSSRKRVEQWLDMNRSGPDYDDNSVSMYGTIRPRMLSKYGRTVSSRLDRDLDDVANHRDETSSNLSFNTTQEFQVGGGSDARFPSKAIECIEIPLSRTLSSSSRPSLHMRLSFGGPSGSSQLPSSVPASETSDGWESPLTLPESSSLLDQLRTHGYKNLVTQRLSGAKLGEPKYDPSENTSAGQYKRGKSVFHSSSSSHKVVNGACIANGNGNKDDDDDTQCMRMNITNHSDNKIHGEDVSPVAVSSSDLSPTVVSSPTKLPHLHKHNRNESRDSSVNGQSKSATGASSETLKVSGAEGANLISNPSSTTLNRSITNCPNTDSKETVQERILRKSFYSRFNDDRPHRSSSRTRRRSSFIEGELIDDFFNNLGTGNNYITKTTSTHSAPRTTSSLPPTPAVSLLTKKPPLSCSRSVSLTGDDMFERMQTRAHKVINDFRSRNQLGERVQKIIETDQEHCPRRAASFSRMFFDDKDFFSEHELRMNSLLGLDEDEDDARQSTSHLDRRRLSKDHRRMNN